MCETKGSEKSKLNPKNQKLYNENPKNKTMTMALQCDKNYQKANNLDIAITDT